MAGFTSLALVGAGLLAGAGASKLANRKKESEPPPLAPSPTDANPNTLAPPAPPIVNPAEAQAQGLAAGLKQRKRAAGGSLLTNRMAPVSGKMPVKPRSAPRTLLGS